MALVLFIHDKKTHGKDLQHVTLKQMAKTVATVSTHWDWWAMAKTVAGTGGLWLRLQLVSTHWDWWAMAKTVASEHTLGLVGYG